MNEKIYFASDFHLGADATISSQNREKIIVEWLESIPPKSKLFLLGDVFDYWYEYKSTVPKGFTRLFSAFHHLIDKKIEIKIFTGNHDVWLFSYIQEEFGIEVLYQPITVSLQGKRVLMGHGDGLGPGDRKYKVIKKIFANKLAQKLFSMIHPSIGLSIMKAFSQKSRNSHTDERFTGGEEWLTQYCEKQLESHDIDYFIFGHRHLVIDQPLSNDKSRYLNIGDWVKYFSYAVMEDGNISIQFFKEQHKILP